MTKVCTKCGLEQPVENFSKNCNSADGLRYECKNCISAYTKAYWVKNIDRMKQYRAERKEQTTEYMKQYCAEHKDRKSEYMKQYYVEHGESIRQKIKVWSDCNKEIAHTRTAMWRKNNPEAMRVHGQTRRARESGLASTLTTEQWKHVLDKFNNSCAYCGAGDKTLHQEHFTPLSAGGEYTHNNIIPACQFCNFCKGAKDFFAWYPTFKHYDAQREKKIMRFLHYTGPSQQLTLCP